MALEVVVEMEAWTEGMEAEEPLPEAGVCTTQKAVEMRGSDELRFGFGVCFGGKDHA